MWLSGMIPWMIRVRLVSSAVNLNLSVLLALIVTGILKGRRYAPV